MGELLLSRRDRLIVARHEVPGTAPPQKSRPVGYGVIRAGVPTDSMIGVTNFEFENRKTLCCMISGLRYFFFPWQTLSRA